MSTEGTATETWQITYLSDAAGRPYGGVYTSRESSAVAVGLVTTDRGDVVELTDEAGVPFARYAYDAYGNPTGEDARSTAALPAALASTIAKRSVLRYASYCYDEHSGLYYLSQRSYDPATASFITKDPAKADGEESAYQYCGGDPVGRVDPSGEAAGYPVVSRYVTFRKAKNLGWRLLLRYKLSKSYIRVQMKFGRRYNRDYLVVSEVRETWFLNGAELIALLPQLKVAAKVAPILKPVVEKVANWVAKGVSKKAVEEVYVQVGEPWKRRPAYMGSLWYWPATSVRYRNIPEA